MRKIKFRYVFRHQVDRDFHFMFFAISEVENGLANDMINSMNNDGYTLVERDRCIERQDQDGKEIFDGDITRYVLSGIVHEGQKGDVASVYWSDVSSCYCVNDDVGSFMSNFSQFKVIGNIYENPEFLKENEQ